jgi:N-acetylmuramoyl-L-alanine amidase
MKLRAWRRTEPGEWRAFVWAIAMASLMLVCFAGLAKAAELPTMTGARIVGDNERTRFVADMDRAVSYSIYVLPNPYRVIIDMPGVSFQLPEDAGSEARGLVKTYRFGPMGEGRSRVVIETEGPALIAKSYIVKPQGGQPARIVADLVATDDAAFLSAFAGEARLADKPGQLPLAAEETEIAEIAPSAGTPPADGAPLAEGEKDAKPPQAVAAKRKERPVIVIDPGHGGIDPGAIGHKKTKEKDVTLAFAIALRDKLRATAKFDVVMTRDGDTFVSLKQRVQIARKHEADLFIAIHADTVRSSRVRGATVYTVSDKASDAEAEELAHQENRADIIAGVDLSAENPDITDILIDLTQRETKNHATFFARKAVKELRPITLMTGKPLRSAGFVVLKAPDVPSILVELGYLSNKSDESLIVSPSWQSKTAAALVKAIDAYFSTEIAQRQ